jgi:hypothetical protein
MKKISLSFFILLISTLVFSQEWKNYDYEKWEDFKVDENVTVQFLSEIATKNIEGGKTYSCTTPKGAYAVVVSPRSDNFQVANGDGLHKVYSDLIDGYLVGSNGKLIDTRTVFRGEIEGRNLRSRVVFNGVSLISEAHFYLLDDKFYQFVCLQKESMYDSLDPGQKHFFEFARFVNNPGSKAQFSKVIPQKSNAEKLGYSFGRSFGAFIVFSVIFLVIGGVSTTIILVIRHSRKAKNE